MADVTAIFGGPIRAQDLDAQAVVDPPAVQLRSAMIAAGLTPPDRLILDGQLHRFATRDRGGDDAGWYVAHEDEIPAGCYGDWRSGEARSWRADVGRTLTMAETMRHEVRMREMRQMREIAQADKHAAAAESAASIWAAATPAPDDHSYLAAKRVRGEGVRVGADGRLITPVYVGGVLTSLQMIDADGGKKFLPGGSVRGGSWTIGDTAGARTVYLCEGVATGLSIREATGVPVVVAYSAGNLLPAARALREAVGATCEVVVVADHDRPDKQGRTAGQDAGRVAADAIGGRLVIPPDPGDANDYAAAGGDLRALLAPEPPKAPYLIPVAEFIASQQAVSWLIKRWIPAQSLWMIHGPSGSGKTFLTLDIALSIATGAAEWCGCRVHLGPVVYLAGEGHQGLRSRIAAWHARRQVEPGEFWVSRAGVDLNTPQGYLQVTAALDTLPVRPVLIVVDTLHRFLSGDENSAQDAKTMLDACASLTADYGCSVALVHHTGVAEDQQHRARGSSAWRGALDAELSVTPAAAPGQPITLTQRKQKDAELASPMGFVLLPTPLDWVDEDGEQVVSAVADPVDPGEVAEAVGKREGRALAAARQRFESALIAHGRVVGSAVILEDSAWNIYDDGAEHASDEARKRALRRMKSALVEGGVIMKFIHGHRLTDSAAEASIRLILGARSQ